MPPRSQNPRRDSGKALKWRFLQSAGPIGGTTADEAAAGEGSSLGSLALACALSQHAAVTASPAGPAAPGAVPLVRVGMLSGLFGRLVISWESPGRPGPT